MFNQKLTDKDIKMLLEKQKVESSSFFAQKWLKDLQW